jgi:hypothetical protein
MDFLMILSFLLAPWAFHEIGHALVARLFGRALSVHVKWLPFPRAVWEMPADLTGMQQAWIAKGGFGLNQVLLALLICFEPVRGMAFWYAVGCAVEWWIYPTWDKANIFNYLDSDD